MLHSFPCNQTKAQAPYNRHQDLLSGKHGWLPPQTAFLLPSQQNLDFVWVAISPQEAHMPQEKPTNPSSMSRYSWIKVIPILFWNSRKRIWPKGNPTGRHSGKFKEKNDRMPWVSLLYPFHPKPEDAADMTKTAKISFEKWIWSHWI